MSWDQGLRAALPKSWECSARLGWRSLGGVKRKELWEQDHPKAPLAPSGIDAAQPENRECDPVLPREFTPGIYPRLDFTLLLFLCLSSHLIPLFLYFPHFRRISGSFLKGVHQIQHFSLDIQLKSRCPSKSIFPPF